MSKVLIIGPEFYDYNLSIERAFRELGFETKVMGYYGTMVASFGDRVAYHMALSKKDFFDRKIKKFNDEILACHRSFKPDVVFIIHGGIVYVETINKLNGSKRVLWMMDSISRGKVLHPITRAVDYNFFFEKTDVGVLWELANKRSWFLPLAVDKQVYFPINKENEIDILFIGALYEKRVSLLKRIASEFKNKNIKVYGTYYSPLRKPLHHLFRDNKDVFLNKNVPPAEVNRLYNRSKICLNIHHSQSRHGVNQRFFEISGSKAFQLVDENPFISYHFTENEIMTYQTEQQMLEKIDYALQHPSLMSEMAEKAYTAVLSGHTFTHRIRYVLEIINSQ